MSNDEKAREILNSAEIPEELEPENIEKLLYRSKKSRKNSTYKKHYIRFVVGLAACILFSTVGIYFMDIKMDNKFPEYQFTEQADFETINDYSRLYEIMTNTNDYTENANEYSIEADSKTIAGYSTAYYYQEENIPEFDTFVTDGKTFFYSDGSYITASLNGDNQKFDISNDIPLDYESINIDGMYVYEDKLIVASYDITNDMSYLTTYKISYNSLSLAGSYAQEGQINNIRIINNSIYIQTEYIKAVSDNINKESYEEYVPMYYQKDGKNFIKPENIYIKETYNNYNSFINIGAVKIDDNMITSDVKSFVNYSSVYCSNDNLYIMYFDDNLMKTDILRCSLSGGIINLESSGVIDGMLLNDISINEYDNYLRIAVSDINNNIEYETDEKENIVIYIFDMDMNIVQSIFNIAEEYNVDSVNFYKEWGFVMAYEQDDSVCAINFSNPENPDILYNISIPKYFYIKDWNDDIFNLSLSAYNELVLSMFDGESSFRDIITDSEYIYNVESIVVEPEKNIIAVPIINYDEFGYIIYSYNNDFHREDILIFESEPERAITVGNDIYVLLADKNIIKLY